jgi:hypothetical protein
MRSQSYTRTCALLVSMSINILFMRILLITLLQVVGIHQLNAQHSLQRVIGINSDGKPIPRYEYTFKTTVQRANPLSPDSLVVQVDHALVDSIHTTFEVIDKMFTQTNFMARMSFEYPSSYRLYHKSKPLLTYMIQEKNQRKDSSNHLEFIVLWKYRGKNEQGVYVVKLMDAHFDKDGEYKYFDIKTVEP